MLLGFESGTWEHCSFALLAQGIDKLKHSKISFIHLVQIKCLDGGVSQQLKIEECCTKDAENT